MSLCCCHYDTKDTKDLYLSKPWHLPEVGCWFLEGQLNILKSFSLLNKSIKYYDVLPNLYSVVIFRKILQSVLKNPKFWTKTFVDYSARPEKC